MNDSRHCDESLPRFTRLNYFYGQALSHVDFRDAQAYVRDKLKLINRCVHGWGVICGLDVSIDRHGMDPCLPRCDVDPRELSRQAEQLEAEANRLRETQKTLGEASPVAARSLASAVAGLEEQVRRLRELAHDAEHAGDEGARSVRILISPGVALSPCGDELVAPDPIAIDLWSRLSAADRQGLLSGKLRRLYVSACYGERGLCPVRPVTFDGCGPFDATHARIGEHIEVAVSAQPPDQSQGCEPCCGGCKGACCVLLAIVDLGDRNTQPGVDNDVRRMLALYEPARIVEVSWAHGATYTPNDVQALLGRRMPDGTTSGQGLSFRFSRVVRASTLQDDAFEVHRYFGGGAPAGGIAWMPFEMDPPSAEWVDRVTFRQSTDEHWSPGDRVMIILRGDYVLDRCCIPIDGSPRAGSIAVAAGGISPSRPRGAVRAPSRGYAAYARGAVAPAAPAQRPPAAASDDCADGAACDPRLFRLVASRPGGRFESWVYVG